MAACDIKTVRIPLIPSSLHLLSALLPGCNSEHYEDKWSLTPILKGTVTPATLVGGLSL